MNQGDLLRVTAWIIWYPVTVLPSYMIKSTQCYMRSGYRVTLMWKVSVKQRKEGRGKPSSPTVHGLVVT